MDKKKQLKLTLIRSPHGRKPNHKACLSGLGLRRMHQSVVVHDDACMRGMINKVDYLLDVTEL